jgi:apolipoprotein N-acyltransferase
MGRGFVSHSDDPDLQRVSVALVRAGQRARELARSTGTGIAVRINGELRVLEGTELDSGVQENG